MKRDLVVKVEFPRSKIVRPDVWSIRIQEREYAHDVCIIVLDGTLAISDSYQTRAPVKVTIGYSPDRLKTFNGYVNHVEGRANIDGRLRAEIVCLGASYVMKKTRQKKWSGTPSQIAAQIVNSYSFNPRFHPVGEAKIASLVQKNESDFKFLCDLAKKIGYTCFVKNTEVNFYPRDAKFTSHQAAAPVFGDTEGSATDGGMIYKFWPTVGETMTDDKAIHVAQGVTPQGGANVLFNNHAPSQLLGKSTPKAQFFKFHTDINTKSATEAEMYLRGKAEAGRWYIRAHVNVDGDARLNQADPVILRGLGDESSGFWIVQEIEHRISNTGVYRMELVVGRDSYGDTSAGMGAPSTGADSSLTGDEGWSDEPLIPYTLPILGVEEVSQADYGTQGTATVTPGIVTSAFNAPTPPTVAVDIENWTTTPLTDSAAFYTSGIPESDLQPPAAYGEQGSQSQYQSDNATALLNTTFVWRAQCRTTPYSDVMPYDQPSPVELNQIPHVHINDRIC